jgi:hypothetical protein
MPATGAAETEHSQTRAWFLRCVEPRVRYNEPRRQNSGRECSPGSWLARDPVWTAWLLSMQFEAVLSGTDLAALSVYHVALPRAQETGIHPNVWIADGLPAWTELREVRRIVCL